MNDLEARIASLEAENNELKGIVTVMAQQLADKAKWIEPKPVIPPLTLRDSPEKWSWEPEVRNCDREWVIL